MTRRGFTLIELLVAVAIIAVLIAVLVPVLASARDSAIGTLCLANQDQLMTAVHQHAVDNKGRIPFGPEEPGGGVLDGADDFYFVNGMVTSQVSTKTGEVAGAGLMLDFYLQQTPQVLFCPGADQPVDADRELEKVGTASAISGYIYRHGSNTDLDLLRFISTGEPMDDNLQLDRLGKNSNGFDIDALFIDNNFLTGSSAYAAFNRSNHQTRFVNIAYADGHAEQRNNQDGEYSVDVFGVSLYAALERMLEVMEKADVPQ